MTTFKFLSTFCAFSNSSRSIHVTVGSLVRFSVFGVESVLLTVCSPFNSVNLGSFERGKREGPSLSFLHPGMYCTSKSNCERVVNQRHNLGLSKSLTRAWLSVLTINFLCNKYCLNF